MTTINYNEDGSIVPMSGFTFGSDPELFVQDSDGVFVSAEGLIPGTKKEPFPVKCGAVQVDGMAAEFNTDPASSFAEFNHNMTTVLSELRNMLPTGFNLVALPAVEFTEEVWDKTPDFAKQLGCSPDFNAWTQEVNPAPRDPENPRLRTGSGHIHFGWTKGQRKSNLQHVLNCYDLVKQLDVFVGAWSVSQDPDYTRRRLYGRAGACRIKPYGVEYRVLSNFWVMDEKSRLEVWNRINTAIFRMKTYFLPDTFKMYGFDEYLIKGINEDPKFLDVLRSEFKFPLTTIDQ